jgi:hypothetical protein
MHGCSLVPLHQLLPENFARYSTRGDRLDEPTGPQETSRSATIHYAQAMTYCADRIIESSKAIPTTMNDVPIDHLADIYT